MGRIRRILCGLVVLASQPASAANVVPNPSFETFTQCPSAISQIGHAIPWSSPTLGSSDYYNTCGVSNLSVPTNGVGVQSAHSGSAYAGVLGWYGLFGFANYREYIEVPLTCQLTANETYTVSFYVSLADNSEAAISRMGAHLSVGSTGPQPFDTPLLLSPQIENPAGNALTDFTNWTLVSGTYVAAGGEDHLTIGNFYDDANLALMLPGPGAWNASYYYIDDVAVELVGGTGPAGSNHHKVYDAFDIPFARPVGLLDQFRNNALPIIVGDLDLFANPVNKNCEGIDEPKEHQTWYRLPPTKPFVNRLVSLNNQFGDQTLSTWDEAYLVVPSEKHTEGAPGNCSTPPSMIGQECVKHEDCEATPGAGIGWCDDLRHFLCYDVLPGASFTPTPVELTDQWGHQNVDVLAPRYFCNPAQKTLTECCDGDLNDDGFVNKTDELILAGCGGDLSLCDVNCDGVIDLTDTQIVECQHLAGGQDPSCCPSSGISNVYPIVDSLTHMTCYNTTPNVSANIDVDINDQFLSVSSAALQNELLCVPSIKYGFSIILDTDDDGVNDDADAFPLNPNEQYDTDGDGTGNNADLDDDGDGLLDAVETGTGIFTDAQNTGTDPLNSDTDGDSVGDGVEVDLGTNPLDPTDFPVLPMMSALGKQLLILAIVGVAAFFVLVRPAGLLPARRIQKE